MIEQTMREYSGHFLFELIQNGYDAQPPDAENGRIAIVLADDEGLHGICMSLDTGRGFTASNARRIRSLGLSDKPVGEGIGNKGIGFSDAGVSCPHSCPSTSRHQAGSGCGRAGESASPLASLVRWSSTRRARAGRTSSFATTAGVSAAPPLCDVVQRIQE